MTIPRDIRDLEERKFKESSDVAGQPGIIVLNPDGSKIGGSGGGDGAILDGVNSSIRATVLSLSASKPLTAAIVDSSGNQITTFGSSSVTVTNAAGASAVNIQDGGNSITIDGGVTATLSAETTKVIGTVRTADGSGNLLTSTTNALDINIKTGSIANTAFGVNNGSGASAVNIQDGGNSITIDGSVTANAGTNLNTSALAVESGGNLALIATSAAFLNKTYTYANNLESSAGTKTLIALNATKKHVLKKIWMTNNDTADGKVALQENGSTKNILSDTYISAFGGQVIIEWSGAGESQANTNKAIELVITTSTAISWKVEYYDV